MAFGQSKSLRQRHPAGRERQVQHLIRDLHVADGFDHLPSTLAEGCLSGIVSHEMHPQVSQQRVKRGYGGWLHGGRRMVPRKKT